jgi:hypothetical protein
MYSPVRFNKCICEVLKFESLKGLVISFPYLLGKGKCRWGSGRFLVREILWTAKSVHKRNLSAKEYADTFISYFNMCQLMFVNGKVLSSKGTDLYKEEFPYIINCILMTYIPSLAVIS